MSKNQHQFPRRPYISTTVDTQIQCYWFAHPHSETWRAARTHTPCRGRTSPSPSSAPQQNKKKSNKAALGVSTRPDQARTPTGLPGCRSNAKMREKRRTWQHRPARRTTNEPTQARRTRCSSPRTARHSRRNPVKITRKRSAQRPPHLQPPRQSKNARRSEKTQTKNKRQER
jgi:hypothetical protein